MPSWLDRLTGGRSTTPAEQASSERKAAGTQSLFALTQLGGAQWSGKGFVSLCTHGFARNPVVYRCVRMITEAATSVPLVVVEKGQALTDHPVLQLLKRPNARQAGAELLEAVYAHLQTAGNAYLSAVTLEGTVRGFFCLRPDRMQVVSGKDGWPIAYTYTAGGRTTRFSQESQPLPAILHIGLYHPLDDHYGMAPLDVAQQAFDIHNAAAGWNKSLLDNAARPSGALVYSAGGNLTQDQFDRLKLELEANFAGSGNAGRPMVLEGGLDWKTIAMSPRDMDFVETKNAAARDIALAFGVPPMLLGIPGDNTYANYAEANKALWRQTVVPLVTRVADELSNWLTPAFGEIALKPDLDRIEALAEDRTALWARIGAASFLSDDEKRRLLGL